MYVKWGSLLHLWDQCCGFNSHRGHSFKSWTQWSLWFPLCNYYILDHSVVCFRTSSQCSCDYGMPFCRASSKQSKTTQGACDVGFKSWLGTFQQKPCEGCTEHPTSLLSTVALPGPCSLPALQSCLCWRPLPHLLRDVGKRKKLANANGVRFRVRLLLNLQPFGGRTKCSLDSPGPQEHKSQSCRGQLRSWRSFQSRGQSCWVWGMCPMHPGESLLPCIAMWHQHSTGTVCSVSHKSTLTCLRDTEGAFLPTHLSVGRLSWCVPLAVSWLPGKHSKTTVPEPTVVTVCTADIWCCMWCVSSGTCYTVSLGLSSSLLLEKWPFQHRFCLASGCCLPVLPHHPLVPHVTCNIMLTFPFWAKFAF